MSSRKVRTTAAFMGVLRSGWVGIAGISSLRWALVGVCMAVGATPAWGECPVEFSEQKLTALGATANDFFGRSVSVSGNTAVIGKNGDAYVFSTNGATWTQQAKLTASDGLAFDDFGVAVALSANVAVVGAQFHDLNGMQDPGAAYVFRYNGSAWLQEQKLFASDGDALDNFGATLSISGNRIIVGSRGDSPIAFFSGSAYTYRYNGSTWGQEQKLIPSTGAASEYFGWSVAISGDRAVVGVPGRGAGVAYVYRDNGSAWVEEQVLSPSNGASGDSFGVAVSISGNTVVVGAHSDDHAGVDSGSAYVYVLSGGVWTFQKKLTASDAAAGDNFGLSVSVSGDTAVVGAHADDGVGSDSGSAYVFVRSGGLWTQQKKLTASDAAAQDFFGLSVSVSGNTFVVGAYGNDDAGSNSGSAYKFVSAGGGWDQQQKLTAGSDAAAGDRFGDSVSVSGDTAVVGLPLDDDAGNLSGSAYVFLRNSFGGVWNPSQKLTAGLDAFAFDQFGYSVSVSGDTAVVGAPFDDDGGSASGSAYVFVRSGGGWIQEQKLTAGADAAVDDWFGYSVSVDGDTAVVGAHRNDDACPGNVNCNSGAAYVFIRSAGVWTQQQKLTAGLDAAAVDQFGNSVSVNGNTALVGALHDDGVTASRVWAYVYVRSGVVWNLQQKLFATNFASTQFRASVSVSGNTAIVGAEGETGVAAGSGSAYVYFRSGVVWIQQQKLTASDAAAGDFFGSSVSVSGDTAVVGADGKDGADGESGSAYKFVRSGVVWNQVQKLTASDAAGGDFFGNSVSVSGDTAVVGAYLDDHAGGSDAGSAYMFSCWSPPFPLLGDPVGVVENRFLSFSIPPSATASAASAGESALRVNLVSLHHVVPPYTAGESIPFSLFEGQSQYVGPPVQYVESGSDPTPFFASKLQCTPDYRDWSTVGLLYVTGEAIVPSSTYQVENLAAACLGQETSPSCLFGGADVSAPLTIVTGRWGDAVEAFQDPNLPASQPDFDDIGALVNKFKSALGAPIKAQAKLSGVDARGLIDLTPDVGFDDISADVDAFKGVPYPYKPGMCTSDPATACKDNTECVPPGTCILCP